MGDIQILALIRQKMGAMLLFGMLIAALSFLFLAVAEKNFKVSTDFLIVQNQTGSQDFYSLSKSAEYIGKIMSEAVYSELFIDEIIKTKKIGEDFLPLNKKERLEEWGKIVKVSRNSELGIIKIEVLGNDQKEALDISNGIIEIFTTKNYLFRGEGSLDVRVLSGPIVEKNPSFSDIILAMAGGFLLGVLISFAAIYYRRESEMALFRQAREGGMEDSGVCAPSFKNYPEPDDYEENLKYLNRE